MKKFIGIIAVTLAVLMVLAVAKDIIIKTSVEAGVGMVTGLKLTIGNFRVGLLNTLVDIGNLRLYNPAGFRDRVMIEMPKIYVDYDLPAIIKGTIHLTEVKLDLKEFVVVKNEDGKLNVDSLKSVQSEKTGKKAEAKGAGKMPPIKIDSLELKIGKVLYKDYSRGPEPSIREFDINLNEKYENITEPYSIVSLIVVKVMTNTAVGSLSGFDVRGLSRTIPGVLASAENLAGQAAAQVQKTATQMQKTATKAFKQFGDVPGKTNETVKKTTKALGDALKDLPFGKKE